MCRCVGFVQVLPNSGLLGRNSVIPTPKCGVTNRGPRLRQSRRSRHQNCIVLSAQSVESDEAPVEETIEKRSASEESSLPHHEQAKNPSRTCEGCGRDGGPTRGCDGTGRIAGGLGAVVDWWPIKAYRPCPELIRVNKQYRKSGQSLEEIAFGRKSSSDKRAF